ncbi:MAG: hypothetical protein EXS51_02350 [Candidatus Taylorbacteria bacterium]|nr:hypothetical protein [Candidatus Taylorbacteria bacterium]
MNPARGLLHLCVLLVLFGSTPFFASAQFTGVGDPIQFIIRPERPAPFDTVSVSLESYSIDLSSSSIIWVVNDQVVSTGGERGITVNAGPAGKTVKIVAQVRTREGLSATKEFRIRPAEVTLLWQSEGYVPPFYRGKALAPYQGRATVVALPSFVKENGVTINPRDLIYTWSENGEPVVSSSGVGKDTFVFRGKVPIRPVDVSLVVTSLDKTLVAEASQTVVAQAPLLLLYENHPRLGLRFNHAIGERMTLGTEELLLTAVPYFFESSTRSAYNLLYEWSLNFETRPSEKGSSITLRRAGDEAGESAVSVTAQEDQHMFQAGRAQTTITFPERLRSAAPETPVTSVP